ncbi:hypothetical protein AAG906_004905 [Vitis piasezkii]
MGCYSTPHILVTLRYSVLEGSNPDNRLITKDLRKGDVLVFPVGLPHFHSQNPGVITIANAVYGSNPAIADDVLAKAFQVDKTTIDHLQAQF